MIVEQIGDESRAIERWSHEADGLDERIAHREVIRSFRPAANHSDLRGRILSPYEEIGTVR